MKSEIKSKRVRAIIDELKDQYMEADIGSPDKPGG